MLIQVRKEIQTRKGPVRLIELSSKLGIEPTVLNGMIDFWVQKGRIQKIEDSYSSCKSKSCCAKCPACSGITGKIVMQQD